MNIASMPGNDADDDVLDLVDDLPPDDDALDPNVNDEGGDDQQNDDDGLDGENAVIRQMRAELRKTKREAAELRKRAEPPVADIGPRPRYGDGSEWGYDEEKCDAAIDKWEADLRASLTRQAPKVQDNTAAEFDRRSAVFTAAEMRHRADPVKAKALDDVSTALSPAQIAVITYIASEKGPDLLLQLARDPDAFDRVADMENPIELAAEIGRMTAGAKTVAKPEIDRPLRGGRAAPANRSDAILAKLEAEADKTGDRTKVQEYKRRLRAKGA